MALNNSPLSFASRAWWARVMIADPYPVIVHGVRKIVEDDPRFQVVAEASTMQSFRKKVIAERPDVALVDWSMASQDLAVTSALLQSQLHITSVLFLTISENSDEKREMVRMGARGFVSKWCTAQKLRKAVFKACNERWPLGKEGAPSGSVSAASSANSKQRAIERLTYRERQLLPLVCSGLKNKEIALRLGIAETTVWHHLTAIFTKLQVDDRLGLAAFAYRSNLVDPDGGSVFTPITSASVAVHRARHLRPGDTGTSGSRVLEQFRTGT
jgi:two-component system, NarL family, nitrate/nitrite response regulator NarL